LIKNHSLHKNLLILLLENLKIIIKPIKYKINKNYLLSNYHQSKKIKNYPNKNKNKKMSSKLY
jgi:hypothetical protein